LQGLNFGHPRGEGGQGGKSPLLPSPEDAHVHYLNAFFFGKLILIIARVLQNTIVCNHEKFNQLTVSDLAPYALFLIDFEISNLFFY